jgi:hypothetical protein
MKQILTRVVDNLTDAGVLFDKLSTRDTDSETRADYPEELSQMAGGHPELLFWENKGTKRFMSDGFEVDGINDPCTLQLDVYLERTESGKYRLPGNPHNVALPKDDGDGEPGQQNP